MATDLQLSFVEKSDHQKISEQEILKKSKIHFTKGICLWYGFTEEIWYEHIHIWYQIGGPYNIGGKLYVVLYMAYYEMRTFLRTIHYIKINDYKTDKTKIKLKDTIF